MDPPFPRYARVRVSMGRETCLPPRKRKGIKWFPYSTPKITVEKILLSQLLSIVAVCCRCSLSRSLLAVASSVQEKQVEERLIRISVVTNLDGCAILGIGRASFWIFVLFGYLFCHLHHSDIASDTQCPSQSKTKIDKIFWNDEMDSVMLDVFLEHLGLGRRTPTGWRTDVTYVAITEAIYSNLGHTLTTTHIENRVKTMRGRISSYKQCKSSHSGFGYDSETGRLVADQLVWDAIIKMKTIDKSSEPDATTALLKLKQKEQEVEKKAKKQFKGLFDKKPGEISEVGIDTSEKPEPADEKHESTDPKDSAEVESETDEFHEADPGPRQRGLFSRIWPINKLFTGLRLQRCSIL